MGGSEAVVLAGRLHRRLRKLVYIKIKSNYRAVCARAPGEDAVCERHLLTLACISIAHRPKPLMCVAARGNWGMQHEPPEH